MEQRVFTVNHRPMVNQFIREAKGRGSNEVISRFYREKCQGRTPQTQGERFSSFLFAEVHLHDAGQFLSRFRFKL